MSKTPFRRSRKDRRKTNSKPTFPFRDQEGCIVGYDRRVNLDRRFEGYDLNLAYMPKDQFEEYYKKLHKDES